MPESTDKSRFISALRDAKVCPAHECLHQDCREKYPAGLHPSAASRSIVCDECARNVVKAILEVSNARARI